MLLRTSLSVLFISIIFQQSIAGIIQGRVYDEINNDPIIGANIIIQGTSTGTITDLDGNFSINNLEPGLYNLQVSYLGYDTKTIFELQVTNAVPVQLNIALGESSVALTTVEVVSGAFKKNVESPVSLNSIGVNEVQRSPGGNRDISRVVQLLPGVSTGSSFRNDLLIRGGASSENRYYLDDIEVPTINHFTTQGASGGSNGLINVDFINNVDFYSGAFPSNRGNSLSAVFEFTQREGRPDRIGFTATAGASDLGLTLEGPIGKKTTFLASARRSYLQFLFKALGLPFLPTYNDFQFKAVHKINKKNDLTFIGLGAIDHFNLNLDKDDTEEDRYQLGYLPYFRQWNYTTGVRYRHFTDNGTLMIVASRSMLSNNLYKYANNENDNLAAKIFDIDSKEAENKLRAEHTIRKDGYKISYGVNYELARYTNNTFRQVAADESTAPIVYDAALTINKYGLYVQTSKRYFKDKLAVSAGLRVDGNDYSSAMSNPLRQLSPRLSLSYQITEALALSANAGIYYQLPAYTLLGYQDKNGQLLNRDALRYIRSRHLVGGISYTTSTNTKFSVEGFYKKYDQYPMLTGKGISFANEGGDYGIAGDESADATSRGKAYGVELLAQQKLYKNLYGILSYTYYRTLFTDTSSLFKPASWDNRHILNLALGYKFKRNWELGIRWTFRGGAPYTPYDESLSALVSSWDVRGQAVMDYSRLNEERLKSYTQLDIRVDKKWFFQKWNLNLYFDIRNAYKATEHFQPNLTIVRDASGQPQYEAGEPLRYQIKYLDADAGTVLPSIGIVIGL